MSKNEYLLQHFRFGKRISIILLIWNIFLQGRSFTNYPQWTGLSHHVAFHYYVQICAGKWFLTQPRHWIDRRDRNSCHICGWRWVPCCLINGGIYLNKESEGRVQVSQCSLCSWTTWLSCSMLEGRAQPLGRTDFSHVCSGMQQVFCSCCQNKSRSSAHN